MKAAVETPCITSGNQKNDYWCVTSNKDLYKNFIDFNKAPGSGPALA